MSKVATLVETGSIDIDAIKHAYPLAEVVAGFVTLKKVAGKLEGLCPFHDERSPSFKIYEKDQHYHCFGCGAHGDVLDFLQHQLGCDLRTAADHLTGGKYPTYSPEQLDELRAKAARIEAEAKAREATAIQAARERWLRADHDFFDHPYLSQKGIDAHGTRVEGDLLLIPLTGEDGKIQTLQSIAADGRKLFTGHAPMAGGLFVIGGKVKDSQQVLLCEGFATGATLHEATGIVTVCAFSAENMARVARRLIEKYPGREYIVAGDDDRLKKVNAGRKFGDEAASILGGRAVYPVFPAESTATDFNDMAAAFDQAAVKALVINGAMPENAVEREPSIGSIRTVDAFDFDETKIPPRPWIIPGVMLAKHTHMLAAPGGSGKSLFTLQLAIMLATGQQWGDWKARHRCRSLLINVEDDIDEQRRRLAAARQVMVPQADLLKGMIRLADDPDSIVVAKVDPKTKSMVATPMVDELRYFITDQKIDALFVDPFAETFEGDENSNSEVKWAMRVWRDEIARPTGCGVYLIHHTTKYAAGSAGSADAIRGAGAIVNSTRISSTLFPMTEAEAKALAVAVDMRNRYVRFDDAKANQTLIGSSARWFEKISVTIDNGAGMNPADVVGALKPWQPPSALSGCSLTEIHNALALIARGLDDDEGRPNGVLYTRRANSKQQTGAERWVGKPIMQAMGVNEERATRVAEDWFKTGLLTEIEYMDPIQRHTRKGITVDQTKLPTHAEGTAF